MKALLSYTSFGVSNRTVGIQDAEEGDSVRNDGFFFWLFVVLLSGYCGVIITHKC